MKSGGNSLVILLIIATVLSSILLLISAQVIDEYPSFVNVPRSWSNIPSSGDRLRWDAIVRPILVNGTFVCGFQCNSAGYSCLFAISIFNVSFNTGPDPLPVVWSATGRNHRNHTVEVGARLQLSGDGKLMLKDDKGALVWSPNTGGKLVSRLNLTAEGNLMLFDKTNDLVWQSFDHPTHTLVLGQRLVPGQELRATVNTFDNSSYVFAIIDGWLTAYVDSHPSLIYYTASLSEDKSNRSQLYADFSTGRFGPFTVPDSAYLIRLGSDGHLKAYGQQYDWEGVDLFQLDRCGYPLTCGNYGICLEEGCGCPEAANSNGAPYFKPKNPERRNLGCISPILPTSCDLDHENQTLLKIQGAFDYVVNPYDSFFWGSKNYHKSMEDCKQACLRNCSCKAAKVIYFTRYRCYLFAQVFSLRVRDPSLPADYNISVFLKVQDFPVAQIAAQGSTFPGKILGSTLGAIFSTILICTLCFLFIRRRFKEVVEEDYLDHISGMPTRFSLEELKMATKDFSNKLGEGGFGSVFQGTLPSGSEIAVKHLDGLGPVNKSFIAEVQTIGSIHHFNLVSLVGFCAEKSNRLLVYEYMPNGSLDQWIFSRSQRLGLDWQIRKKIILGIAKGLAYLHEECYQKIIHLDIKPQNILLDDNFNAKVSDFGLSKLIEKDQSQVITTMRGTPGYMAPEWLSSIITEKVDVYSFGIVVLEILCGRRNVDGSQQEKDKHLLSLFRRKREEEKLEDLVDKRSDDMQSNAAEVVKMMNIAAWCLQTEYVRRPSMSVVVKLLLDGLVEVEDNWDMDFLNGLTAEAVEAFTSEVLPSMLSGPR